MHVVKCVRVYTHVCKFYINLMWHDLRRSISSFNVLMTCEQPSRHGRAADETEESESEEFDDKALLLMNSVLLVNVESI